MIGQTAQIAPADKKLYALRDVTGTVESIPLISASIMSKKIAEGIDALVLDVKTGSGAFMKTEADSRRLAESLVSIGNASGVQTEAIITGDGRAARPRGRQRARSDRVHRGPEGRRPAGSRSTCRWSSTARMLVLGSVAADRADAERQVRARDRVGRRPRAVPADHRDPGRRSARRRRLRAAAARAASRTSSPRRAAGYLTRLDAELVGRASVALGAGRDRVEDPVDPAVGIMVRAKPGDAVRAGDADARAALPRSRAARRGRCRWRRAAITIGDEPPRAAAARSSARCADARRAAADVRRRRDSRHRLRVLDQPARHQLDDGGLGPRAADRLRAASCSRRRSASACSRRSATASTAARVRRRRRRRSCSVRSATRRLGPRDDRRARAGGRAVRGDLRVPGAADDHLHRRAVRHPLLLRRHAARRPAVRRGDAPRDARERRRIAERRGQHLHGPDRSAADDPARTCRR